MKSNLILRHWLIHEENQCAKFVKMTDVTLSEVFKGGINHRQFKDFSRDMKSEHGKILCYTEARRCVIRGRCLKACMN